MKFAVNYSTPLEDYLRSGLVEVDMIKCPDWDSLYLHAMSLKPVHVHFDILVGLERTNSLDLRRIRKILELTHTAHLNCHLVTSKKTNPSSSKDLLAMKKQWEAEINILGKEFGFQNIVAEHFPFMPYHPHMLAAVDARNISEVVNQTGCNFLLDLAHARITATNLGINLEEYILSLPVSHLKELHITGMRFYGGYLVDHFSLDDEDWSIVDWFFGLVAQKTIPKPTIAAFEYGGIGHKFAYRSDPIVILKQVPQLYQKIKLCDQS